MKWPNLVPQSQCVTPITLHLTDGIDENGAPNIVALIETTCSYNGKGGFSMDAQRQLVRYSSAAIFCGDIAPELAHLTGWVEVFGLQLTIHTDDRARNPDGTVNYVRLELI